MTAALGLEFGRRAPLGREELRRQLLALVLTFVLVWYTFVVPAHAGARSPRSFAPDDEGHDGEVRGVGSATPVLKSDSQTVEDLDWPDYIYPE
jgi:hypothetical protein